MTAASAAMGMGPLSYCLLDTNIIDGMFNVDLVLYPDPAKSPEKIGSLFLDPTTGTAYLPYRAVLRGVPKVSQPQSY